VPGNTAGSASTEALEKIMTTIITIAVIAIMFAWVPLLNYICPPGWSSAPTSEEKKERETRR
jgi:cytochrome c oxidase assembly protein Cox11